MKEIWKPIKNFEGIYEISNFGRVKSHERKVEHQGGYRTIRQRILKPRPDNKGYYIVGLHDGKENAYKIHTIVWDHFGNKPRNGMILQVDHKDGNNQNNRIDNLQLLTNRKNSSKRHQQKGTKYPTGVSWHRKNKKFKAEIQIDGIQKYLGYFNTATEASDVYQKALKDIG